MYVYKCVGQMKTESKSHKRKRKIEKEIISKYAPKEKTSAKKKTAKLTSKNEKFLKSIGLNLKEK